MIPLDTNFVHEPNGENGFQMNQNIHTIQLQYSLDYILHKCSKLFFLTMNTQVLINENRYEVEGCKSLQNQWEPKGATQLLCQLTKVWLKSQSGVLLGLVQIKPLLQQPEPFLISSNSLRAHDTFWEVPLGKSKLRQNII